MRTCLHPQSELLQPFYFSVTGQNSSNIKSNKKITLILQVYQSSEGQRPRKGNPTRCAGSGLIHFIPLTLSLVGRGLLLFCCVKMQAVRSDCASINVYNR